MNRLTETILLSTHNVGFEYQIIEILALSTALIYYYTQGTRLTIRPYSTIYKKLEHNSTLFQTLCSSIRTKLQLSRSRGLFRILPCVKSGLFWTASRNRKRNHYPQTGVYSRTMSIYWVYEHDCRISKYTCRVQISLKQDVTMLLKKTIV